MRTPSHALDHDGDPATGEARSCDDRAGMNRQCLAAPRHAPVPATTASGLPLEPFLPPDEPVPLH